MKNKKIALLLVDADNDFIDPAGSMYIPTSDTAMFNLSKWIGENGNCLTDIFASQDAHKINHIGNICAWKRPYNKEITKGTIVRLADVECGDISPIESLDLDEVTEYLGAVRNHTLWPHHGIDGSWGQAFPLYLTNCMNNWSLKTGNDVVVIRKGQFPLREMYSIFTYNTPYNGERGPKDAMKYLEILAEYDIILVAGQAKDYCVADSVKDMIKEEGFRGKIVFISDALPMLNPKNPSLTVFQEAIEKFGAKEIPLAELMDYINDTKKEDFFVPLKKEEAQEYLSKEGFWENSHPLKDDTYGEGAYFVRRDWIKK